MKKYPKIQTVYKRDPKTNHQTLLEGNFSTPEIEHLAKSEWVFTEKIDGTNIRVIFDSNCITFRGRNGNSQIPAFLFDKLNDIFLPKFDLFRDEFPVGICLYGEGCGNKINGGSNYSKHQEFVLFDIRINHWWLKRDSVEQIAKKLEIPVVPIVGRGTIIDMVFAARNGFASAWGNFLAEGIVARPAIELQDRGGRRIITKVKYKDFHFGNTGENQ